MALNTKFEVEELFNMIVNIDYSKERFITHFLKRNKIKNRMRKRISTRKIKKILNLLHDDYNYLGAEVNLYGSKIGAILRNYRDNNTILEIMDKGIGGTQSGNVINIHQYNFNHLPKKESQLYIIFTLFHELRHVYQMEYKPDKYFEGTKNYISNNSGYHNQWLERDANSFASRMMNRNSEKINEILNIDEKWYCIHNTFYLDKNNK